MIQDLFRFFHNALESINHQLYPRREATLYSYEIESYQDQMFYYDDGHDRADILDNYNSAPDSTHSDPPAPPSQPLTIREGSQPHNPSSTRAKQAPTTSPSSSRPLSSSRKPSSSSRPAPSTPKKNTGSAIVQANNVRSKSNGTSVLEVPRACLAT
ncbi:hypothetical protein HMI54_012752 [Coelomomyces lativittatus]|nr:hypothetical protein HMI54_012752 [Coelomomyces lativittatus]